MDKFQNKYRIQSARAQWWNYGNNGAYFITICIAGREYLFGNIKNYEMVLYDIGNIVLQEWEKSFEIRAELFCDAFVIMPNHIHGIVQIYQNGRDVITADDAATVNAAIDDVATADVVVETHGRASLRWEPRSKPRSKLDLNHRQQNESTNTATRPNYRFGNPDFTIILSAIRMNISE